MKDGEEVSELRIYEAAGETSVEKSSAP